MKDEDQKELETEADDKSDDDLLVPSHDVKESIEINSENESDVDSANFFSDLLQAMRMDDPDYTVYSRYHIHVNHAIDLGDLLIATILALIFIHMFLRDFIRR